jgi:hypothetical protein
MIVSASSRRHEVSDILIPEYHENDLLKQEVVYPLNGSQSLRRSEQSHTVDLNVYPSTPGSLTALGSAAIQIVGSGSLTKGLNDAGLQVNWLKTMHVHVSALVCLKFPFAKVLQQ